MINKLLFISFIFVFILSGCGGFTVRYDVTTLTPARLQPTITPTYVPFPESTQFSSQLFTKPWSDPSLFINDLNPEELERLSSLDSIPRYRIELRIDSDLKKIVGIQEVLFTNTENINLDEIIFRMYPALFGAAVQWDEIQVDGQPADYLLTGAESVLHIPLKTSLKPGEAVMISISFAYQMPDDGSANYNIFASSDNLLTLAHFYPMLAVFDEDGWHEEIPTIIGDVTHSDAAFYLVRIIAPENAVLVTSGHSLESKIVDGMQQEVFATGPARDFFICAGYDLVEDSAQVAGITVRSFTPAKLADGRKAALSAAAAAIRTFSELLGPYPYREFDVIATNTNALGVEYPGLTTINQQLYFPDEKPDEGIPNNILLESVIAHETAHQWLYNKIGNDQVNEPWLDESLTQYATYRYYVDQYGSQAAKGYLQDFYSRWDRVNRANIPIGKPVEYYADGSYSAIVYGRGAIFFYELEQKYGISMMDDFFHDYVKKYSWDLVSSQEMKDSLEAACQCDLNQLFMDWVE